MSSVSEKVIQVDDDTELVVKITKEQSAPVAEPTKLYVSVLEFGNRNATIQEWKEGLTIRDMDFFDRRYDYNLLVGPQMVDVNFVTRPGDQIIVVGKHSNG